MYRSQEHTKRDSYLDQETRWLVSGEIEFQMTENFVIKLAACVLLGAAIVFLGFYYLWCIGGQS